MRRRPVLLAIHMRLMLRLLTLELGMGLRWATLCRRRRHMRRGIVPVARSFSRLWFSKPAAAMFVIATPVSTLALTMRNVAAG